MRMLMIHVDCFSSAITQKGRSKTVEDWDPGRTITTKEALLILTSVERRDESNPVEASEKASVEIAKLADQLKVETIVLHPFAHLFSNLSDPTTAVETLKLTEQSLVRRGFKVIRTPFGWFNTIELKAKGHPLSRVARTT